MRQTIRTLGVGLFIALLAGWCGTARAAELPTVGDLLEQVTGLQQSIAALEESGQIKHGRATALSHKLDKVSRALGDLGTAGARTSGDVSAQQTGDVGPQQIGEFLQGLQRAIDALLDFISDLTKLLTDLPSDVIQPIIDAAIELLRGLIDLLLGALGGILP
jgi:hypothetical protein